LKIALTILIGAFVFMADSARAGTIPIGTTVELDFNEGITDSTGTFINSIQIGLYDSTAPQTVANFLKYVNSGEYDGTIIHRSVPNFVIQGGGYAIQTSSGTVSSLPAITSFGTVPNEYNADDPNVAGTISMALVGSDINSATSQWFINTADNSASLDPQSFTVFGQVLGNGMELVNAINSLTTQDLNSAYDPNYPADGDNGPFSQVPLTPDNQFLGITNAFVVAAPEPPTALLGGVAALLFGSCVLIKRRLTRKHPGRIAKEKICCQQKYEEGDS
jgi:cyclophilin family peptidyl-prolyl cis-trans isomerase